MSAWVDAEARLDPGFNKGAVKGNVALLEARDIVVADGEIEGRPVRIGDVGRQAGKHVPAVESARIERLAEGGAEHVRRPAGPGGFALRHRPEEAAREAEGGGVALRVVHGVEERAVAA